MPSSYAKPTDGYPVIYREDVDGLLPADAQSKNNMRYVYFKKVAQGGKCDIHSCKDLHLGRVVCHKKLRREFADDSEQRRHFLREARVTAMLQHPNTAPVYEVGSDSAGHYYFTMKLVTGATLFEVLSDPDRADDEVSGRWSFHRSIDALIQVAQVLSYAHVHGVVHCDVKPENVVIGSYGEVLLLDWGMADLRGRGEPKPEVEFNPEDRDQHQSGETHAGTPEYMSPEQIVGNGVDCRTDIYSLGAILFEILTGKRLAWGRNLNDILQRRLTTEPPPPSVIAPNRDIPETLESLCLRCLQRRPARRIQTMLEVIHELLYWLRINAHQTQA